MTKRATESLFIDQFVGHFDKVDGNAVVGWAVNPVNSTFPAKVEVWIDDVFVGTALADKFREDLESAQIREGYAGFFLELPILYFDQRQHVIRVIEHHSRTDLSGSPASLILSTIAMADVKDHLALLDHKFTLTVLGSFNEFREKAIRLRRIAIICTFSDQNFFGTFQVALFRQMSQVGYAVMVVHAFSQNVRFNPTSEYIDYLMVKQNVGYDFGSWALGYFRCIDFLDQLDEIVVMNDSIFISAPQFDSALQKMRTQNADFWGMTDSFEHKYHLQSYFVSFGKNVILSGSLTRFFLSYSFSSDKEVVIKEGELGLTEFLLSEGYRGTALCSYIDAAQRWIQRIPDYICEIGKLPEYRAMSDLANHTRFPNQIPFTNLHTTALALLVTAAEQVRLGAPLNPVHFFWDILVEEFGLPCIKRELLFKNPTQIPTLYRLPTILKDGHFNVDHIYEALVLMDNSIVPLLS